MLSLNDAFKMLALSALFLPIPATIIFFNVPCFTNPDFVKRSSDKGFFKMVKSLLGTSQLEKSESLRFDETDSGSLVQVHSVRLLEAPVLSELISAPQKKLSRLFKYLVLISFYLFLSAISANLILFYLKFEETLNFQSSSMAR